MKQSVNRRPTSRHLEGIGDPGSFLLTGKRGQCRELIASVQINRGRRTIFINEVALRNGSARAMKKLGIKDYASLKASLTKKLRSLSSGSAGVDKLRWPIKCVFHCPVHESCENYDWIGFWD